MGSELLQPALQEDIVSGTQDEMLNRIGQMTRSLPR